ncbi:MAG TPA: L-threonylcarbamoyladenylate synthase [Anaerolineae bacterium]|nr:L-threonylcarbamoyladenylate synthase [Anaerolineae bacterium]
MLAFKPRQTRIIKVDPENPGEEDLIPVADAAREGESVVFPTDTVYGIGTNSLLPEAVLEIFRVKERPADKPLILLVADPEDVREYVADINEAAERLISEYWPGPLTLIFKKSPVVPPEVTAGGDTVGVRCPNNPVVRMLVRLVGVALATTSANIGGRPSPRNADEAEENLWGRVAYIVDGGETKLGIESTVLDLSSDEPKLVREGFIPWSELREKLGR